MARHFISFFGSHDLGNVENGPITALLKYLKPTHIYLFITKDYVLSNDVEELKRYYENIASTPINIIETEIKDPTNHNEIYNSIINDIERINEEANELKSQIFLNLTSGTPAIISVLSLLAMSGFINKVEGAYAPNPKYNTVVKTDKLAFYRNSFAYKTLKSLINDKEYGATLRFLKKNKEFKKLLSDEEFTNVLNFANERIIGNFEKAEKYYNDCERLNFLEYKAPANLYERAMEYYTSVQVDIAKNNDFKSLITLGIIREILTSFLCQIMLNKTYKQEIVVYDKNEEKSPIFNLENLETYGKDLKEALINAQTKSKSNMPFDFKRDINAYTESLILEYLLTKDNNSNLEKINKNFNRLQELKGKRNILAHRLCTLKLNPKWNDWIKELLELIAEECGYPKPDFVIYKKINEILLDKLKQALN